MFISDSVDSHVLFCFTLLLFLLKIYLMSFLRFMQQQMCVAKFAIFLRCAPIFGRNELTDVTYILFNSYLKQKFKITLNTNW